MRSGEAQISFPTVMLKLQTSAYVFAEAERAISMKNCYSRLPYPRRSWPPLSLASASAVQVLPRPEQA